MSRILVVADGPAPRAGWAAALRQEGFEVETAADVGDAPGRPGEGDFDLVLAAHHSPDDQLDLCRRIKASSGLAQLPVVLVNRGTDPVTLLRGLEAGADGFLPDTPDPPVVTGRLRRVLARGGRPRTAGDGPPLPVALDGAEYHLRAGREHLADALVVALEDVALLHARHRREIAEQKNVEAALTRERDLLHALMDNVPDSIYFKDLESRFIRLNPALASRFGLADPAAGVGKTDRDFFGEEHARRAFEDEQEVIRTGRPMIAREEKEVWPDGRVTWALSTKMPLRSRSGAVIGTFGISRDITARIQAEAELRAARDAAEAASRTKGEFLANMSHEIRTPMNAVIGMTELLGDTELTPEQREYLELVRKSADALLGLINDILDFSKIEAGRLDLDRTEFALHDVLGDTLSTLSLRAYQKGLELACHVAPDVPDDLVGDPGRLRQVVTNLVGNALKFTEAGEVVVSVRLQEAPAADGGRGPAVGRPDSGDGPDSRPPPPACLLRFEVRDTGIGIAREKQKQIFAAFTQADNSTTRRYGGTGLGLTISARLVELMGGRIWVESEAGKGSTFYFTVRLGLGRAGAAGRRPAELGRVRGLRALVVDDNATNRRILEETFAHWGMRTVAADGGPAALDALDRARADRDPFAVILLDAHMPGMDGFTLARLIRSRPDAAGAKIMMLTSGGQPGDAARCKQLGFAAYQTKPVKQADLWRALLRALDADTPTDASARTPKPPPAAPRPLRILLAEDNPINQKLAVRLLEKQGHTVDVAGNGREVLAALFGSEAAPTAGGQRATGYDIVLMDVQMPDMDGLSATAAVREREKAVGGHTPIIAMTAYAMTGDRERCLAAGMDAYISKPIRPDELFALIGTLAPAPPPPEARPPAGGLKDLLDWDEALRHVRGDVELLREMAALFPDECVECLSALRAGLARRDAGAVGGAAHRLKGSLGTLAARGAHAAALRLETMAREGSLEGGEEALALVERELAGLRPALEAFARGEVP